MSSSNKRHQQDSDLYTAITTSLQKSLNLLEKIDELLRETLEDSVSCIESRARWFEHLSEPDQIERVLQRMVTEGKNMTAEHLKAYIDAVLARANWEMCQKLHQTEIALHRGLVSLRKSLSTISIETGNLKEHINHSNQITSELQEFHRSMIDDNKYTKAQEALIDAEDEFDFNKFVQDSIDMAFREDPRALLGLHSATMFLEGIKKAAINLKYTWFADEMKGIMDEEAVVWAAEVVESYQALKRKKTKRS